jgi:undecaprenyl-diphosphatase
MAGRRVDARSLAITCAVAFVVLTVLVALGALDSLDVHLRNAFRPHDRWGHLQTRADHVIDDLRPTVMAGLLAIVAVVVSVVRRSWRPAAYALVVGGTSFVLTVATKALLGRPGPRGPATTHGGSFPSGHTSSVIVCLGVAILLLSPGATRLWQWLIVAALGTVMGLSLILVAAHWVSDVVGAALLSTAILAFASPWAPKTSSDTAKAAEFSGQEPVSR